MMNPCYECQKYREYGKYLDEVLICKTPVEEKAIMPIPVEPVQKKKPTVAKTKAKPKPQSDRCEMIGCGRKAEVKGYCRQCRSVRKYYEAQGKLPPVALTPDMIKNRGMKGA